MRVEGIITEGDLYNTPSIQLKNATELLRSGMKYILGTKELIWQKEYDDVATWLTDNHNKGLLCLGDCGRGKTLICYKLMDIVLRSYFADWCKAPFIKMDARKMGDMLEDINDHYYRIIIIDDVGTESETVKYGERHNSYFEMLDYCEKNSCLLIVTSNLTMKQFEDKYGTPAVDRMLSLMQPVVFKGNSLRR